MQQCDLFSLYSQQKHLGNTMTSRLKFWRKKHDVNRWAIYHTVAINTSPSLYNKRDQF